MAEPKGSIPMPEEKKSAFGRAIRNLRELQEAAYHTGNDLLGQTIEDALEVVEEMGCILDSLRTWMLREPHLLCAYKEYLAMINKTKGR